MVTGVSALALGGRGNRVIKILLALWMMAVPTLAFAQAPPPLWWCAPLRQYYPTVPTCPAPWLQVARPPGLSQAAPQAEPTSDPHCELIADRARRDFCFAQTGIPIVHCNHPQNADDVAFCRDVLNSDRAAPTEFAAPP